MFLYEVENKEYKKTGFEKNWFKKLIQYKNFKRLENWTLLPLTLEEDYAARVK